ncbi:MAG TPA: substrate-binding domain-containing protein [Puia sp.]|jgi:LacI family transcriptional regulator
MKKKVSLKDVAEHVGASIALVSYVMNNKTKPRVGVEMSEKIRNAARELGYQPNLIARGLKMGTTNTIGLIVADISNPFFSHIARIIEDEAKKNGYVVIFGSSDESAQKSQDLINVFLNRQVDAFIIASAAGTEDQVRHLTKMNVPVVLIDRYFPEIPADSVHIDNYRAAYQSVEHLIATGRKRIAMVAYKTPLAHMNERKRGWLDAMNAHGLPVDPAWMVEASFQNLSEEVDEGLLRLLRPSLNVDAVFFGTNSLAVEGLKEINALGIKVPSDLAIISFDESEAFDFFYSPVTYVSQSLADMGKAALKLVIDRIGNSQKKNESIIVETKLIVRKSSGS